MLLQLALAGLIGLGSAQKGPNYPANTIDQIIDHFPNNPRYEPHTRETFKQRYYFDSTYYKPGGPVFLYIGGETSGPSRFENLDNGIIQILMEATNGLGVILENRYYGESYPVKNLTTDSLAYLTNQQTIADNAYFAQNVKFPGISQDLTAPNTPWILYGGSLAGAQTAFSLKTYPGLLWGGIASSGVIKAKLGYPEWYKPIQKNAPQDCVASINALVDKIDLLFAKYPEDSVPVRKLKSIFGLESLTDNRDFATTINFPIGNPGFYPLPTWQELNAFKRYNSPDFFHFCSNVTNLNAPQSIQKVDLELAKYTNYEPWKNLGNYANYVKKVVLPACKSGDYNSFGCFGTQHPKAWAKTDLDENRSYLYTACTEGGAYIAAPQKGPSLLSRVVQTDYEQQWCDWAFPKGKYNSIPKTPKLEYWNKYGGYNVRAPRLAFIDGAIDPWLDNCYHSDDAPPRHSTDLHPELLIAGAGHHWDSYGTGYKNLPNEPQFIMQAHLFEIRTVQRWLEEFKEKYPGRS